MDIEPSMTPLPTTTESLELTSTLGRLITKAMETAFLLWVQEMAKCLSLASYGDFAHCRAR